LFWNQLSLQKHISNIEAEKKDLELAARKEAFGGDAEANSLCIVVAVWNAESSGCCTAYAVGTARFVAGGEYS
jgi:hypothetical protein